MWLTQMPSGWQHQGPFMGTHWLWWLFWILLLVVLVWVVLRLARGQGDGDREEPRRESAEEALRRRFSEGEIGEEEFRRRMRLLRESRSGGDGPREP